VASTVYGGRSYLSSLQAQGDKPKWIGVECCGFHQSWTKEACGGQRHNFYLDDTLLTKAALKEDLGVAYLPCFMGDTDPELERCCPPDPQLNLGLWLLFHPDMKRTARVLAFRNHLVEAIRSQRSLFEGRRPHAG
jgi:DNA-binding transcriptional LysR family regulator